MIDSFGFILSLSQADNDALSPIIANLQYKYCNQPPFEPHLSIYHPSQPISLDNAIKIASDSISGIKPFTIQADGFGHENVWTKILYISIKPSLILDHIRSKIKTSLHEKTGNLFIPHISLMYKDELNAIDRAKIVSEVSIPNTYTVTGINIQSPGQENESWRDYTKWENVYSLPLSK